MTTRLTWLPPLAAGVTVLASWLAGHGQDPWSLFGALAMPLLVPAAWAAVAFTEPALSRRLPLVALGAGAGLLLAGWPLGIAVVGQVAAGLAAGTALRWRWPLLRVLAFGALCLVPGFFLGLGGSGMPGVFEVWGEHLREQHAAGLPADLPATEREASLAEFETALAGTLDVQRRLWPSLVAMGLLVQMVVSLALGWALASLASRRLLAIASGPFIAWRAPFGTVWCLIGGLGLVLAPAGRLANDVGWNLVLVAALLLAAQGLAVLAWLIRRQIPPLGRTLFWIVGALFFAPVLCGGGALIGLVDQWWELRRPPRPPDANADKL